MAEKDIKKENLSKIAIKGSIYTFISLFILKFGGLIFTIIIARLLLPELFGVYSLALSLVTIILVFTDLGTGNTLLRYVSDFLGKRDKNKARSYGKYLLKIKFLLILLSVVILLAISKFLSYTVYENPLLYYPLIFSSLFIISESLRNFFVTYFSAKKDMKTPAFFDFSVQILKIIFSIIALLILTDSLKISGIFLAFFLSSFITLLLVLFVLVKRDRGLLVGKTEKIDKKPVNTYLKYMALASLSLVFFGSIDTLMLGKFVISEYLGYYRVSLSLVLTAASIFSLSGIFLPIFTQINKRRFERGFQKTMRYLLIISIPATVGLAFIARHLIYLVYGKEYLLATSSIYFLVPLIITTPLIGLYSIVLQSKEKARVVGNSIFISLIANIGLNYLAIKLFIQNPLWVIGGVGLATTLSRLIYLGILMIFAKKTLGLKLRGVGLRSPIFATAIMILFLLLFNRLVDMTLILGGVEIISGILIYFGVLILTKGLIKEDFDIIRKLFKK